MINFDYNTKKYNNLQKATIQGCELSLKFKPITGFSLNSNYTYTQAFDENEKQLFKRPAHKAFVSLDSELDGKKILLSIITDYKGKRFDIDTSGASSQRVSLSPYTLFHLRGGYKLEEPNIEIFFRLKNIFNRSYQESFGYSTAGRTFFAGIQARL